jgi:hypothetical protein
MSLSDRDSGVKSTPTAQGNGKRVRKSVEHPQLSIADFNREQRWCAWRGEEYKDGSKKTTKVPYCDYRNDRDCRKASSDRPNTWIRRDEAEACWQRMQRNDPDAIGGVGLFQGQLNNGFWLMGLDLDSVIDEKTGVVDSGAEEIIKRFDSYAEVSPSGTGVKLFFLIAGDDKETVDGLLNEYHRGKPRYRKTFGAGEHREMAFDTKRYYAVTENALTDAPIQPVKIEDVDWFFHHAGPAYVEKHSPFLRGMGERGSGAPTGRDETESGHGFRFLRDRKQQGMSYDETRDAILADEGIAGQWARSKGDDAERSIKMAWENAHVSNFSWDDPDISLLDDRRGDLPPFPLEVLEPPSLQDLVQRAAHGAGCSIDHVAMPMIGVAGGLVGTSRRVRPANSWSEPLTNWPATVGLSGTGKTPGLGVSKRAVDEVEEHFKEEVHDRRREHEQRVEEAAAAEEEWRAKVKEAKKEHRKVPPKPEGADRPGKFIAPRLTIVDVTIERMCELLVARPQGMVLIIDELAGLLLNMSRYSGGQDNQFWLMAWDGRSYSAERKNGTSVDVPHLLIGIVGGIQPDRLPGCFKTNDGMHARFLWHWPAKAPYRPLTDDIDEVDPTIFKMFEKLSRLGERSHKRLPLSQRALAAFERLRKAVEEDGEALAGREREWWAKIPTHVLRLAGTLCYMRWALIGKEEPDELLDKYIKAATRVTLDYLWPHARACLRQIGLTERHADACTVLRWIKTKGLTEVRREDIRRDALSQKLDAEQTEALLQHLAHAGWLRRAVVEKRPGRPANRWEVNPTLLHSMKEEG